MLMIIILIGTYFVPDYWFNYYGIFWIVYIILSLILNTYKKRSFSLYEKDINVSQKVKGANDKIMKNNSYHVYLNNDDDNLLSKLLTLHIARSHRDIEISKKFYDDLLYDNEAKYNIAYINKMKRCYQSKED